VEWVEPRFEDLFDLEKIQELQDHFARATGVASLITRPDGVPLTRPSTFCRLCTLIRTTEKGRQNCYRSHAELGKLDIHGPKQRPCMSGGLWDGGAGISVAGKHIANWLIGQIRDADSTDEEMMAYAREIGADQEEYREALKETRVMPAEQFSEICRTLHLFATTLSESAYRNYRLNHLLEENRKTGEDLRKAKSYLDNVLNSMPSALIGIDSENRVTLWNNQAEKVFDLIPEETRGKPLPEILPELNLDPAVLEQILREETRNYLPNLIRRNGGKTIRENITVFPLLTGGIRGAVIRVDDVTREYELEQQLIQSRKMEAVGRLAGGIAHDFNNMLGGILGAADLLEGKVPDPLNEYVEIIQQAAERAADLISKLLTFSRKGPITADAVDIHEAVRRALSILERSIDRKVRIILNLEAENHRITGDETLLENTVLNIGINASQAMPGGGTLTVSSRDCLIDEAYCRSSSFPLTPGPYLELLFEDTGPGIPGEIRDQIFEPFFTTKAAGQGTGLGLSAVLGIVQDHRGEIQVADRDTPGAVIRILFPCSGTDPAKGRESPADDRIHPESPRN